MRIALISDIHANLEALEAVLVDIKTRTVDETLCLGDIVGYGANPNECLELVKKSCTLTLLGNHDAAAVGLLSTQHFNIHAKIAIEWTVENLSKAGGAWLKTLPLKENKFSHTLVHATPYEPNMWYYITSLEEAAFNFQFFDTAFCFVGHTHIPITIVLEHEKEVYVHQGETLDWGALENVRFLINVGSVGQPRDRNSKSCYGIIDSDAKTFTYHRVAYDVQKAQAKMRKIKMPEFLITRLEEGR
ncbi:MAG TPA: metallophosphoesterase family protein [Chitinivibrionales bacterium]|nr:metallophosphoesterase family protein [Chitinivibrionales bacterium]